MRKKTNLAAVIGGIIAVTVAVVLLLIIRVVIDTGSVEDIVSVDTTSNITFHGTFETADGTGISVDTVEFEPKEDGMETVSGSGNGTGNFTVEGIKYNSSYVMTVKTSDGNEYTGEVLFFEDHEDLSYSNLADGIDFGIAESNEDTITATLSFNDSGYLQCQNAS